MIHTFQRSYGNRAGPYGAFPGQTPRPILCCSSSLKHQRTVSMHISWVFQVLKWSGSHSVTSDSLRPQGLHSPWNSPGQNTGVSSHSILQGIVLTQGSNPGLPHCRRILYQLSHKGSPRILEWVACPFSSLFSQPRNWTGVSCIGSRFFTSWATREALSGAKTHHQMEEINYLMIMNMQPPELSDA